MKVAIDGPAGSGKSTIAHALADRCGLVLLDTGAMYRSVTLACLQRGVDVNDAEAVAKVAHEITIAFGTDEAGTQTVSLDGIDVTKDIRTPEIDKNVSAVSAIPEVREAMVALQREMGNADDVVAEGRDIGTVVFPDAEVKVFLTADPEARAHRRAVQRAGGDAATDPTATADAEEEQVILQDLQRRDQLDSTREVAPLKPAEDAYHLDSSSLTIDEEVAIIVELMDKARVQEDEQQTRDEDTASKVQDEEAQTPKSDDPKDAESATDKNADKPKAKAKAKAKKEDDVDDGPMHVFSRHELEEFYDHPIREFPITSRMLLGVTIGVCGFVSKLLWHWTLEDGEYVWKGDSGQVVIMNHESMIDPVILVISSYAHGRRTRILYKSELDNHKVLSWYLSRVGAIPVKRGTADIKAIRRAQRAIQRGEDLLIFPEGTRVYSDDQEVEIHGGFALIAQLAKAKVVPVAIVGCHDGAPGGGNGLKPCRIFMKAGQALTFAELGVKGRKQQAKAMEKAAMDRVYELRDALRAAHPGKL